MIRIAVSIGILAAAVPAQAEVVSSGNHGFELRHSANFVVPAAATYAALGRIGGWWSPAHTYSGSASNLSLSLTPGGCFCERLPGGGGVEHLRVAFVDPGKQVVLTGSLGPLLYLATSGVMDIKVEPIAGGSRMVLNYRVAGFASGGADKLAPAVDKVLAEQIKRFRAFAAARPKPR